jgi:AcrR family transcriptional regulator
MSDESRPPRDPAAPPRERIVKAALPLLARRGFAGVALRSLAAEVGLHNSSLFHHFRSKAEIAAAVFEDVLERVLPPLERLDAGRPDLDVFVEVLTEIADAFASAPDDARFLLRAIIDGDDFLYAYKDEVDPGDASNPLVRLFTLVWGWLGAARQAGVIRPVRVHQAARNLIGILVFEPTYGSSDFGDPRKLASRRRELAAFVRGALAPVEDTR